MNEQRRFAQIEGDFANLPEALPFVVEVYTDSRHPGFHRRGLKPERFQVRRGGRFWTFGGMVANIVITWRDEIFSAADFLIAVRMPCARCRRSLEDPAGCYDNTVLKRVSTSIARLNGLRMKPRTCDALMVFRAISSL
jgi:hypothetical protein